MKDGGILKTVIKKGDLKSGFPLTGDGVEISWKIRTINGKLLHTRQESSPLLTIIGAKPNQIFPGWDIGLRTMNEGEISTFLIAPQYGSGYTNDTRFPSDEILQTELYLHKIIPSSKRTQSPEQFKDELYRQIRDPTSDVSREIDRMKDTSTTKAKQRYYNPNQDKLHPQRKLHGEGLDHIWEEDIHTLDIQIPLPPELQTKEELQVIIR
jgi:hypothetical protein